MIHAACAAIAPLLPRCEARLVDLLVLAAPVVMGGLVLLAAWWDRRRG